MKKFAKPWNRPGRGLWYVTLDGRQLNLGPDKHLAFEQYKALLTQPKKWAVASDSIAAIKVSGQAAAA